MAQVQCQPIAFGWRCCMREACLPAVQLFKRCAVQRAIPALPRSHSLQHHADDGKRSEAAAVLFQYNVMGTRGPRKMKAIVPALASDGSPMKLLTSAKAASAILEW